FGAHDIEVGVADAALLAAFVRFTQFWVVFFDAYDWQINGADLQALTNSLNAHFLNLAHADRLESALRPLAGRGGDGYGFTDALNTAAPPVSGLADWSGLAGAPHDFLRHMVGLVQSAALQKSTIPNTVPSTDVDFSGIFGARPIDGKPLNFDPFVYD